MTVYLDIETTTAAEVLWAGLVEAGLVEADDDLGLALVRPASLAWLLEHAGDRARDPVGGRVVCWAVATSEERDVVRSSAYEAELLTELRDLLFGLAPSRIIAHFGHGFDFPFLRARSLALSLPDLAGMLWSEKPWDERLVDTSLPSWTPAPSRGDAKGWPRSLDALAELLGIERPPQLSGAEVPAAWYQGRAAEVEAHCLDDVRTLRTVTRRLAAGRGA